MRSDIMCPRVTQGLWSPPRGWCRGPGEGRGVTQRWPMAWPCSPWTVWTPGSAGPPPPGLVTPSPGPPGTPTLLSSTHILARGTQIFPISGWKIMPLFSKNVCWNIIVVNYGMAAFISSFVDDKIIGIVHKENLRWNLSCIPLLLQVQIGAFFRITKYNCWNLKLLLGFNREWLNKMVRMRLK